MYSRPDKFQQSTIYSDFKSVLKIYTTLSIVFGDIHRFIYSFVLYSNK